VNQEMTTPLTPMPFTMRILGRRDPVRFPDEETGLAALDQFAIEHQLAVHYNFTLAGDSAIATAYPHGGDAYIDAVAVLRQEPMTSARLRVPRPSETELSLTQLLTLFGPPRRIH